MSIEKLIEKALSEAPSNKIDANNEIVKGFLSAAGSFLNSHIKDDSKNLISGQSKYNSDDSIWLKIEIEKKLGKAGEVKFTIEKEATPFGKQWEVVFEHLLGYKMHPKTYQYEQFKDVAAAQKAAIKLIRRNILINDHIKQVMKDAAAVRKVLEAA